MTTKKINDTFSASKEFVIRVAEQLGRVEPKIKELDRICSRNQKLCVSNTFYTGVTFFGLFVISVFSLNVVHEFLHYFLIEGYGVTVDGITIGLLLSNVKVGLPAGLPWWDYLTMVYGPLLFFAGVLLIIMWVYPRIDVAVYQVRRKRVRYGKMLLRGAGIYISTALLFNTLFSPIFNFVYHIFVPWYGRTDLILLWDISLGMVGTDQFVFQTVIIVVTIGMALLALAYIFSNRIFGKEKITLG